MRWGLSPCGIFRLVPDEGLPPCRAWKIYVVKATHTDIGLHNYGLARAGVTRQGGDLEFWGQSPREFGPIALSESA